jgi:hypothetical protein
MVALHYEALSVDAFAGAGVVVYAPVTPDDEALLLRALGDR